MQELKQLTKIRYQNEVPGLQKLKKGGFFTEVKVKEINKSAKTLFSTKRDKVKEIKAMPVENSCKHKIKLLEEEIRKILESYRIPRFKDYGDFKDVFKKL